MLSGIREVLIITTPEDQAGFIKLLGDGSQLGMRFEYKAQLVPNGLAQAFVIGAEFVDDDDVCLILGDNIFFLWSRSSRQASKVQKYGTTWLDTGTFDSLMQASQFVEVIQSRQGLKIFCIEEIAHRKGFINGKQFCKLAELIHKSGYREYLLRLVNEK